MNPTYLELIFRILSILGLLLLNALLVTCEFSFLKLRFSHFNPDILNKLKRKKSLSAFFRRPGLTIRVIRIGIISCTIGYGILLYPTMENYLHQIQIFSYAFIEPFSIILSFIASVALFYTMGELVPRGLALQYPVQALEKSAWAVKLVRFLTKPFVHSLNLLSRYILQLFNVHPNTELDNLDVEEQLDSLEGDAPFYTSVTLKILKNSLHLRNRLVQDIILPRNQVVYFNLNDSIDQNIELAKKSGHTRFPLCEGDLDQCIGVVHIKDIFLAPDDLEHLDLRQVKRDVINVMTTESLDEVLEKLLESKTHMALVLDEFGGINGVVTLENIFETLVGSIQDEFDYEEELIKKIKGDIYLVSGLTPIHEFEDILSIEIKNKEVSTVSGLITAELGHIPQANEKLKINGLDIAVTEVDETRVIAARVRVLE